MIPRASMQVPQTPTFRGGHGPGVFDLVVTVRDLLPRLAHAAASPIKKTLTSPPFALGERSCKSQPVVALLGSVGASLRMKSVLVMHDQTRPWRRGQPRWLTKPSNTTNSRCAK